MSVSRKIELSLDLDEIEATALELNMVVQHNTSIRGYNQELAASADLVISPRGISHPYQVGFSKVGETTIMVYDDSFTKALREQLMPAYYERVVQNKLRGHGFRIDRRSETSQAITIYLKKGV